MNTENIYITSSLIKNISKKPRIAFLDIDLTITGKPQTQKEIRDLFETHGYSIVFVTSRPYELLLSDSSLAKSPRLSRPPSKIGIDKELRHYHIDLASVESFAGLLDPDALADTTGGRIYIRQKSGEYLRDRDYDIMEVSASEWRSQIVNLLKTISNTMSNFELKKIEDISNYEKGIANISPPDFRIQIDFKNNKEKKSLRLFFSFI